MIIRKQQNKVYIYNKVPSMSRTSNIDYLNCLDDVILYIMLLQIYLISMHFECKFWCTATLMEPSKLSLRVMVVFKTANIFIQ